MGIFRRRNAADYADTLETPTMAQEDLKRLARLATATSEEELADEAERSMWRTLEEQAVLLPAMAEAVVGALDDATPELARASVLEAYPRAPMTLCLANLVEYEIWKRRVEALDDPAFEECAAEVESRPENRPYYPVRVGFLEDERRRRGLAAGEVRDPRSADALRLRALGVSGSLCDQRFALRSDWLFNHLEAAIQAKRADMSAAS